MENRGKKSVGVKLQTLIHYMELSHKNLSDCFILKTYSLELTTWSTLAM